jgi:hypothetical protein
MATQDQIEQERADKRYEEQVAAFRKALNAGDKQVAYQLARSYNWPTDMITDEVMDWLCDEPKGQR